MKLELDNKIKEMESLQVEEIKTNNRTYIATIVRELYQWK